MSSLAHAFARALRVPPPEESVPGWHVSPGIDFLAYHWSWLFILLPLLFMGDAHPDDYRWIFVLVLAGDFTHQAISMPFVYLDRDVFKRNWKRFTFLPLFMLGALFTMLALLRYDRPTFDAAFVCVGVVLYTWNFWHVFMQKYGILRLYNAKAGPEGVPGWVDRLFVFGWLPLYLPIFAMTHGEFLTDNFGRMKPVLVPLIDGMFAVSWLLVPLTAAVLVASIGLFLRHEFRAHGWRCTPRLSMAIGLTCLGASFILFNPVKAAIAFGFSHIVEYFVFAWAFQRRYYREPLPHRPLFGRMMSRPTLAFAVFMAVVGGTYVLFYGWQDFFPGRPRISIGVYPVLTILLLYAMFQAMVHFYFDGFLWKMRRPAVRANI